jgi:O-antigen biosynthesis protein WbqP
LSATRPSSFATESMPIAVDDATCRPYRWKRASDLIFGAILLLCAALPMALIAVAIWFDSGRPALLRQRRVGCFEREFLMWKFRTLPVGTPQVAKAELPAGARNSTRLGRFLRRYSLDELPQLLNVLTGDMSLVGPRPALYTQHELTAMRKQLGVLRVRPGLTGIAQVSGREDLDIVSKVQLDADYVRRMSPRLDLEIVLRTGLAVLRARGSF